MPLMTRVFCVTFALVAILYPQDAPKRPSILLDRGPELIRLDRFIGHWKGELTRYLPGGRTLNVAPHVEFDWDVGGVWLRGRDTTTLPSGDVIENVTWMTWHKRDRRYHGAWQDNVFPSFTTFTASWSEDEDELVLDSGATTVNGRAHRIIQTYRFVSDDEYRTQMRQSWDDGPLNVVATAVFRRVDDEA